MLSLKTIENRIKMKPPRPIFGHVLEFLELLVGHLTVLAALAPETGTDSKKLIGSEVIRNHTKHVKLELQTVDHNRILIQLLDGRNDLIEELLERNIVDDQSLCDGHREDLITFGLKFVGQIVNYIVNGTLFLG